MMRPDGTATVYIGAIYEVELSAGGAQTGATSYYAVPGARVQRSGGSLYYVLTDHLGSASVTLDSSGAVAGEQRYYPFGATRLATGTWPTDRLFTGQRRLESLGLDHFAARFYSPALGRFVSADAIVPEPGDPQSLNRYTYAYNNPTNYIDPSGNCAGTYEEHDSSEDACWGLADWLGQYQFDFGFVSRFNLDQLRLVEAAYYSVAGLFPDEADAFVENFNTLSTLRAPWNAELDAIGVRLAGSAYLALGGDFGLEMIINFRSYEVSYFVVASVGYGWAGGGAGVAEAMVYFDLPNNAAYREYSVGVSAAGSIAGVGVSGGYAINTEIGGGGRRAHEARLGLASGLEFSLVVNASYAFEILRADFRHATVEAFPDARWSGRSDPDAYDPWPW